MKNITIKLVRLLPGLAVAGGIATLAFFIEQALPIHIIGSSVIALLIGIALNLYLKPGSLVKEGLNFASKTILKVAIILLGASLSITTILTVGGQSLIVMVFTLATCFGVGYFVGKALGLNWKMSNLISAGTGICGGSAIAAIAPVIDADDTDIAFGMSATFIFDMIMIIIFPLMGRALGLSDMGYGLWAGTAVNDTSSVVAAGYAFSEIAGDYATMVKLTRTLAIIPTVLVFSVIGVREKKKKLVLENMNQEVKSKINIVKIIPWFILGFLLMAGINSMGYFPAEFSSVLKEISQFSMIIALAAIGMKTDLRQMKKAGLRPMLHGFIISALVVGVSLGVQYLIGAV